MSQSLRISFEVIYLKRNVPQFTTDVSSTLIGFDTHTAKLRATWRAFAALIGLSLVAGVCVVAFKRISVNCRVLLKNINDFHEINNH